MQTAPGRSWRTSSTAVCSFMQTKIGESLRWATYPLPLARMWNQVGRPSMFDGKTFLPLQGMPMPCRARSSTRLADWLPEPLTVPTRMASSLTATGDDGTPSRTGYASTTDCVGDMVRLRGGYHG